MQLPKDELAKSAKDIGMRIKIKNNLEEAMLHREKIKQMGM